MIYCYGEILWDMLPDISLEGGALMNVCMNLNKLGSKATLISAVGNDEDGYKLLDYLRKNHLNISFIQVKNQLQTGRVLVDLSDPNNAIYDIVKPVAYDEIEYSEIPAINATSNDFVVFGSLALRKRISRETLFELLKQPFTKIFDVNLRTPHYHPDLIISLLKKADWVKLNDDEFLEICSWYGLSPEDNQIFSKLSKEWNAKLICLTRGGKGATLFYNQEILNHPGFTVQVEDTIGAGDAFLAALINSYTLHKSALEMLNNASALGAFIAGKKGGNPIYQPSEIKHFIM